MIDKTPILAIPPKAFGDKHFAAEFNKFRMFMLSLADESNTRTLGYKGYLKISDPKPTEAGLYRLIEIGTYSNLTPAVDNNGNPTTIVSLNGKLNEAYYDGTKFVKSQVDLPVSENKIDSWIAGSYSTGKQVIYSDQSIYEANASVISSDVPGVSSKWTKKVGGNSKVSNVLKHFLEQPTGTESLDLTYNLTVLGNSPIYGISLQTTKLLKGNNTTQNISDPTTGYYVFQNIPLSQGTIGQDGVKKVTRITMDILPYGNSPGGTNANLVGIRSDGSTASLISHPTTPAPTTLQHYEIDVTQFNSISIGVYISSNTPPTYPDSLNQVIKFYTKSSYGETDSVFNSINKKKDEGNNFIDLINFGCVGDGVADDTSTFNAAIVELISRGGGTIYGRDRKYKVSSITIPDVPTWLKIEIAGSGMPVNRFGTVGNFDISGGIGTMQIISTLNDPTKGVINVSPGSFNGFNMVFLSIKNLAMRTYNNPNCWGINAINANQLNVENFAYDTGVYNVQASDPTNLSVGILTPQRGNGAFTYLRNVSISGVQYGIQVEEHTDGDQIILSSCKVGLLYKQADHASYLKRVCSQRNTTHVKVIGSCNFIIEELNMEYAGAGQTDSNNAWQNTVYELDDATNLGVGEIKYHNVKGALGKVNTFRFNGGSNVIVKRIGNETRITTTIPSP